MVSPNDVTRFWHDDVVTAPFAAALCGFRSANHNPNTSDNNDKGSIELGQALFDQLGVPSNAPDVEEVGSELERQARAHLEAIRPDLAVGGGRSAMDFEQYEHLKVFRDFQKAYLPTNEDLLPQLLAIIANSEDAGTQSALERALRALVQTRENDMLVTRLRDEMPEESLLKIDITVASRYPGGRLLVALSSKWTLRTDRAQDCISQGSKLVNQRRGHMSHYSVLTMEPRPSMLRLIASGSGAVDCVYHLALPELREAAALLEAKRDKGPWGPRGTLERLVAQKRVRDYDDLVAEVRSLPPPARAD
jgi:hypothetical protein